MTENEKKLIGCITRESNWNGNLLDFSKPFAEQELDDGVFQATVEVADFAAETGMSQSEVKGVLGSLTKKGLISVFPDSDCDFNWLEIDEAAFNKIRAEL